MPELNSQCAHVPPKQIPSKHYFAVVQLLLPGLSSTHDICDWFKEMRGVFSPIAECACVEPELSPVLSSGKRRGKFSPDTE